MGRGVLERLFRRFKDDEYRARGEDYIDTKYNQLAVRLRELERRVMYLEARMKNLEGRLNRLLSI